MIYADTYHPLYSRRLYIIARALPCLVPGCRLVPFKIAASGARALLAMTNLIGFAGKRNNFRNETFEKRCEATQRKKITANNNRKNRPLKMKNVLFPNKNVPIFVSLRGAQRRGNLKAEGMASRGEARKHEARRNPHYKKGIRRVVSLPLFTPRFCFVPLYHSSLRDGKPFRLRLPRRAHAPSSQ